MAGQRSPERQLSLERMVTVSRAEAVARKLYPDEMASGFDCRQEHGREGQPCRICGDRNEAWKRRVEEVRAAMVEAFA